MFDYQGVIVTPKNESVGEDNIMMTALDSGADDVIVDLDNVYEIICKPENLHAVRKAFENAGDIISAEAQYVPQNVIELDKESAISINKLIVALEDLDDVQNVYTNADLSVLDENQ